MRKIAANYVFPVHKPPVKNGIIVLDDNDTIVEVIEPKNGFRETAGCTFFNGAIVPGFVNAHCHIELSYMKGKFTPEAGLPFFLTEIRNFRKKSFGEAEHKQMKQADQAMYREGIVAVGDISNGDFSFSLKEKSPVHYHTFIEVFGMENRRAEHIFAQALRLTEKIKHSALHSCSVTPHATYSVSEKLFSLLKNYAMHKHCPVSIHNQECEAENTLFERKAGELFMRFNEMGINVDDFKATGKRSLPSVLPRLPDRNPVLFVHNTYIKEDDLNTAKQYRNGQSFWVICPNANLFIEKKLPDLSLFRRHSLPLCIGTDSLAANSRLSVLHELKTIHQHFPEIPFDELLKWATINGAKALGIENRYGTLENGKQPGLVLLEHFDFNAMTITEKTTARKL